MSKENCPEHFNALNDTELRPKAWSKGHLWSVMSVSSAYFYRKWIDVTLNTCQIQWEDRNWRGRLPVCAPDVIIEFLPFWNVLVCHGITPSRWLSVACLLPFLSLFLNSLLHQALSCDLACLILCFLPDSRKKQSILLAFSLLFALLFTLSVFVQGNGGPCAWMGFFIVSSKKWKMTRLV